MPIRRNDPPLILTALLDSASFAILDGLRRRHFPAELNQVPAHVSLFHHLPGSAAVIVLRDVEAACRDRVSFDLRPDGVRLLGRGVAIGYEAPELRDLRAELAASWSAWLTPQDRQRFKPHVTIQNKVTPEKAKALRDAMQGAAPPVCIIEGVAIWRYLGGPWETVAVRRFQRGAQDAAI